MRNEFLQIAIAEGIGNLNWRNRDNYLPYQIEHVQPIDNIPQSMNDFFAAAHLEKFEADYMIVTNKSNSDLIK